MRRALVFLVFVLAVASFGRNRRSRPRPQEPRVHEALVLTFEEMVPADRVKIRSRFASSRTFGRVSWRNGKMYCFLTRPGQEVDRAFVEERLDGKWQVASFEHLRSVPIFGTASGIKNRP